MGVDLIFLEWLCLTAWGFVVVFECKFIAYIVI